MSKFLTQRQQEILETLRSFIAENSESPTLSELQDMLHIGTKRGVVKHLEALDRKGYIYRTGTPRGIKVIADEDNHMLRMQVLGFANAGTPLVFAQEDIIGTIQVDKSFIKTSKNHFCLMVKGDSMNMRTVNKVPIADNSYVIVEKDGSYSDGDVVLAVVDNAATIKTFKKSNNSIILYPESSNPVHSPIYLNKDSDSFINGKVIAVLENPNY